MTAPVTVTAADRECAAQIMELQERKEVADLIRAGDRDSSNTVQIAARHRQQAEAASKAREAELHWELERLRIFVTELANNPRKPATWMQTREAAALLLAGIASAKAGAA